MTSERDRMLSGELYLASDPELTELRRLARVRLQRYNANLTATPEERREILRELLGGELPAGIGIEPPFFCDYGVNITLGAGVFMNFGCVILDCARVAIGEKTMFGPYVQLYTAHHPVDPAERAAGPELASPITIGSRCWLGGGVIVCPGSVDRRRDDDRGRQRGDEGRSGARRRGGQSLPGSPPSRTGSRRLVTGLLVRGARL